MASVEADIHVPWSQCVGEHVAVREGDGWERERGVEIVKGM